MVLDQTDRTKRIAAGTAIAMALAAPAEGLRQWAYFDPPGVLTVCRGHTGPDVIAHRQYSLAECDSLFTQDMRKAVAAVDRCQPELPPKILGSFADAGYNMGPTMACDLKHSTAARKLKAHDYEGACREFPRWDKARVAGVPVSLPGLTNRRNLEMTVCLEGVAEMGEAR